MEAVKAMKEGKKVKRECWTNLYTFSENDRVITNSTSPYLKVNIVDMEATDWEIYEEEDNWNLGDKTWNTFEKLCGGIKKEVPCDPSYCHNDDIKTFIQKVKEDMMKKLEDGSGERLDSSEFKEIIDKRAGDL